MIVCSTHVQRGALSLCVLCHSVPICISALPLSWRNSYRSFGREVCCEVVCRRVGWRCKPGLSLAAPLNSFGVHVLANWLATHCQFINLHLCIVWPAVVRYLGRINVFCIFVVLFPRGEGDPCDVKFEAKPRGRRLVRRGAVPQLV